MRVAYTMIGKLKVLVGDGQLSRTTTEKEHQLDNPYRKNLGCPGHTVLPSGLVVDVLEQASGLGAPVVAIDPDDTVPVVTVVVLAWAVDVASEPVAGVRHLLQPTVTAATVVDDFLPAAHVDSGCLTGVLAAFDGEGGVWC